LFFLSETILSVLAISIAAVAPMASSAADFGVFERLGVSSIAGVPRL